MEFSRVKCESRATCLLSVEGAHEFKGAILGETHSQRTYSARGRWGRGVVAERRARAGECGARIDVGETSRRWRPKYGKRVNSGKHCAWGRGAGAGRSERSKVRVTEENYNARDDNGVEAGAHHLADMLPYRDESLRGADGDEVVLGGVLLLR